jgi:UDP-N-acetylmuramate--alanine ligase
LTTELISDGIDIHFEDNINLIPSDYYQGNTLVIITPAVPITHSEWNYFLEREYLVMKRAAVLGLITKIPFALPLQGLKEKLQPQAYSATSYTKSGADVTAFIGGIVENYDSNLIGTGKP